MRESYCLRNKGSSRQRSALGGMAVGSQHGFFARKNLSVVGKEQTVFCSTCVFTDSR